MANSKYQGDKIPKRTNFISEMEIIRPGSGHLKAEDDEIRKL